MPPMKPKKVKKVEREIQYETEEAQVFKGENALTVDQAKHLLGWEEQPEGEDWKDEYFLLDENGKKVRLTNNTKNRPFRKPLCEMYIQEHLQLRWKLNGENIIIGKFGEVVDGQHRLSSLVLAEQRRLADLETHQHWGKNWPGPVTMQTIVVTGVEETDEVVNTINTGASRSMGDVLYRSEFFADEPTGRRKQMARAADYAIRLLWHRTGAGMDAFAPRRTHAEALDFLARHPRLVKCLRHVVAENGDAENRIGKFISLGYAAALMFLMGSGKSDYDRYRAVEAPSERRLDWSLKEKSEEFWSLLAGSPSFQEVRYAMAGDPSQGGLMSLAERMVVIIKAWRVFTEDGFKGFTENDPRIVLGAESYQTKDDVRILVDNPTCGGIDLGEPRDAVSIKTNADDTTEPEPTPEEQQEVEEAVTEVRDEMVAEQPGKGVGELVQAARKEWPGRLIAFKHRDHYRVWGKDADTVSKVTGIKKDPKLKVDGLQYLRLPSADFDTIMAPVVKAKNHVVLVKVGASGKPELIDGDYEPK